LRCLVPVKVLLADDSEIMRRAIQQFLQGRAELELVGEACDFHEAIALADALRPDVLVLDVRMAEKANAELNALRERLTSLRLVGISAADDEEIKTLAARLGADTLIDKMEMYDKLAPAILQFARPAS
jgi:DNA-binding NarL/FixJ family response regulator